MIRRSVLPFVAAALVFVAADHVQSRAAVPNVVASRYDVTIDLLPDGSLDVVERITLSVGSTPIRSFERRVPGRRTDGLVNVTALMDGRAMAPLQNGAGVRIRQRSGPTSLDARWEFEPLANGSRTFELRYRAVRALARNPAGPHLQWTALPTRHAYPIDAAHVTLRAPRGTLAVELSATGGDLQPATSWQDGQVVIGNRLGPNDSIALDVVFSSATISPLEPEWAVTADHAQKLMPAFVAAGLTLLVVGAGTLGMITVRMSPNRDVAARGALQADRVSTSRGLITAGFVLIAVAVVGAAVLSVYFEELGPGLLAMPAAVFVDGVAFLVAGRVMSITLARGMRRAASGRAE